MYAWNGRFFNVAFSPIEIVISHSFSGRFQFSQDSFSIQKQFKPKFQSSVHNPKIGHSFIRPIFALRTLPHTSTQHAIRLSTSACEGHAGHLDGRLVGQSCRDGGNFSGLGHQTIGDQNHTHSHSSRGIGATEQWTPDEWTEKRRFLVFQLFAFSTRNKFSLVLSANESPSTERR